MPVRLVDVKLLNLINDNCDLESLQQILQQSIQLLSLEIKIGNLNSDAKRLQKSVYIVNTGNIQLDNIDHF